MSHLFAPFQPEPDEPRRRRFKPIPIRALIPNFITLLSLCLGLTAIRMAVDGKFELAITAIIIAGILDGIDGRIARLLHSTSRFGAELDSLADFVNFGVATSLILYFWGLNALHSAGWIAVLVFTICMALRLARFNVMLDDPNKPPYAMNFFTGVPAPAGAVIVMLPIYLELMGVPHTAASPVLALVYVVAVALLLVSWIPTWSGKGISGRVPREHVLLILICVVFFAALLVSYPWEVLSAGSLLYVCCIPVAYFQYKKHERAHLTAVSGGMIHPDVPKAEEDRPAGPLN
jgi:CDP-diacylglycerol--serine O-phosphatidyltransferase